MRGTVSKWFDMKGYGFIKPYSRKKTVFCHASDLENAFDLETGDKVEFELEESKKGARAVKVKIIH